MHNNEWSLIFFTLISQLSVGILLMFSFVFFVNPNYNESQIIWWKSPELLILLLLGFAGLISLLHLGRPINAPKSVSNFAGSWISKEILSLIILFISIFVLYMLRWILPSPMWLVKLMLIISSLASVIFIYSMKHIYMIETIPSWNTRFTPLSFFSSVLLFFLLALFLMNDQGGVFWRNIIQLKPLIIILIIFLMIQIVLGVFQQSYLSGMEKLGIENISFTKGMYVGLFCIKMIILIVSVIYLFYLYLNSEKMDLNSMAIMSLILILIFQEFIGRFMFYQSYFRIGV